MDEHIVRPSMRPWLLLVLLVELATYANSQANIDFGHVISEFSKSFSATSEVDYVLTGEVVSVIDGDTIDLVSGAVRYQVQLFGIDAPELGQTFGEHVRLYLLDVVESQTVRVEVHGKDQFGAILGELFVNQVSINELMLTDGYTWAINGIRANQNWPGLEQLARDQSFGLWRYEDVVPPWEYRKLLIDQ